VSRCRLREISLLTPRRSRLYAWWYFTIALGFLLLAINRMLVGEKTWLIVLRVVIAAGFAALGYMELRAHSRTK
jgi:hypothetical protein